MQLNSSPVLLLWLLPDFFHSPPGSRPSFSLLSLPLLPLLRSLLLAVAQRSESSRLPPPFSLLWAELSVELMRRLRLLRAGYAHKPLCDTGVPGAGLQRCLCSHQRNGLEEATSWTPRN